MDFNSSPSSSATSSPISIGWPSPSTPLDSYSGRSASSSTSAMTCAFPSWPTGPSLGHFHTSAPSAFISDADLFPDELLDGMTDVPLFSEAPAPPRQIPFPTAVPLLPLYAQEKPKKQQRRRSSNKKRRPSKPMTPIVESPEMPE
jgi:hypothetical protein